MAKVKTTVRFQILELLDSFVDQTTANTIGQTVVDEAKRMISEGQSPVRGYGRFDGYSDTYKQTIKNNPRTEFSDKNVRPVNLSLTGKMLSLFGFRVRGQAVEVGFVRSGEHAELAEIHNEGLGKMPQRRMVPGDGEEWSVTIMRAIRDVYETRLEKIIRQANKRE
jgi:hypothetical protein